MRRLIVLLVLLGQSVWGQNPSPDLSWTFKWGTNTVGILFAQHPRLAFPADRCVTGLVLPCELPCGCGRSAL